MKRFNTVDEIRNHFIKTGWNNPVFDIVNNNEYSFLHGEKGRFYKMRITENIYNDHGTLVFFGRLKCKGVTK